jgi:hypothetical protein
MFDLVQMGFKLGYTSQRGVEIQLFLNRSMLALDNDWFRLEETDK